MTKYEREQFNTLLAYYEDTSDKIAAQLRTVTDAEIRRNLTTIQKQIRDEFDRLRAVTIEFVSTTIPSAFKARAYQEYMRIARRRQMGVDATFIGRPLNVQIAENIAMDAAEAFEYGLASGEKNILSMLRKTQQALISEEAVNRAVAEGYERASVYGGSRYGASKQLMKELLEAVGDGEFVEVNGRHYKIKDYAKLTARTKIMEANNEATIATAQEFGSDYVQVSSHNTNCAECAPLEGKVYSISGNDNRFPKLTDERRPPYHPNCVLESTPCKSLGRLISGLRAFYDGEIIEFDFAQSGRIAVTINHMFLTKKGFIKAQFLNKGDNVFYCPDFERELLASPNINRDDFLVENIFIALQKSSGMATGTMPASPENVHGDGKFFQGNIDIIGADGFLRDRGNSGFIKHFDEYLFEPGNIMLPNFIRRRYFTAMFKRLALAAHGRMSGSGNAKTISRIRAFIHKVSLLRSITKMDAGIDEAAADCLPTHAKTITNFLKKYSGIVELDQIIDIKRRHFAGHVYNLQTETGLYISNGLLSSNCLHSLTVIFLQTMERRGIEKYSDFSRGVTDKHPTNPKWKPISQRELE